MLKKMLIHKRGEEEEKNRKNRPLEKRGWGMVQRAWFRVHDSGFKVKVRVNVKVKVNIG